MPFTMFWFRALMSLTVSLVLSSALPTSSNPVVDLGYAQYQGVSNSTTGVTTYYGLQYAAPPTGAQRWQPPIPIENSTLFQDKGTQIINATSPGYMCPQTSPAWIAGLDMLEQSQGSSFATPQTPSEDCLRLDVIVPNAPASSSLPVVVQIHGGGYTLGSSLTYDGTQFTSYSNGSVIYVQIQYRLGLLGFLGNQAIKSNGVANAGLLDQRLALEWVQRHVPAFGGDATKVTIWGGSAGGGSVTAQLQLYGGEANPPFRAAIAEYPWWQPFHDDTVLEAQYSQLLQASSCTDLDCLRSLPSAVLVNATQEALVLGYNAGSYGFGDFYAGPSVDGNIIKELPSAAFAGGRYTKVPLLTDREGFEGVIFSNFTLTTESEVQPDLATLWQTNSTSFFTRLFQLYPLSAFTGAYFADPFFTAVSTLVPSLTNNSPYWQTQAIFGDFIICCPTYYIASDVTDAAQPVWKLVFAAGPETHGATATFLLSANDAAPNATIAAYMKSYFLGFAVNLDPNSAVGDGGAGPERPQWPMYLSGGEAGGFMVLDINQTSIGTVPDPDASGKCDFFRGQGDVVRN